MNATPIFPEDDPDFFPSMPTQRGGASRPGEPPRGASASAPGSPDSMETIRGRTTPRGERLHAGDVLLGRYTVLSELGQGGMGVVYKCLDNVGGIEVALKCLPPELSRDETEMEGIRENYAIVARLHHSAISGLRNLEKDPDFDEYYLVMDLAEGEDLSAMLRRRHGAPMPPQEALAILRPLASALDYAHGEKVLHRDVKPANVKVDFQGGASRPGEPCVQLLDFGLAAEVRSSMSRVSLRGHAGTSGTPAYMAPEQWEARPQSAATDQYALAVMAYQMLAGHLPFDADDTDLLRRAVLTRAPDPVPGLPRGVNAALQRALAKDPAARFPSCGAFVESLARGVRGGRLAGTARPTTRWIAAAAAVAVAVAGVLWFTQSRRGGGVAEGGASPLGETQSEAARAAEQAREEAARNAEEARQAEARKVEEARRAEAERKAGEEAESKLAEERMARSVPPAPALPPDGASLEDLQAARGRFADALDARRAEGWPDDSPGSQPLVSAIAALDERVVSALEAQEKAEREAEAERLAKLEEDRTSAARTAQAERKAREAIRVLQTGAARDAKKAEPYRKWAGEGEFKARFATLDGRKEALDGLSAAADLTKAQSAAADVRVAADWIADNGPAREELGGLEAAVAEAAAACEKAEGDRYAKAAIYRAQTTRDEAVRLRDRGEFAKAKERLESAKVQYESALASARSALAAAKAKEALVDAEAAKIREDWDAVLAAADKALEWEPGNVAAQKLKQEAEANLRPILAVSATLDGVAVSGATLRVGNASYDLPKRIDCSKVRAFGPGEVSLEKGGKTYVGTLPQASIDWKGERAAVVALEERKGPKPGEPIDLGGGVKLEMVHCPGVAPDFWMGKYEVTQEQWQRVMGNNPSHFKNRPKNPVETVSWNDCQEFVRKLNALPAAKASGLTFRLPTEEEWETACRAGAPSSADYCRLADGTQITASTLSRVARYDKGSDDGPVAVGSLLPNAWGLYDMHGNVWEWTSTAVGDNRVLRGGGFFITAGFCTAGIRFSHFPDDRNRGCGLRLAASGRPAASPKPETAARLSDGGQAARSAAASRSEAHTPGEKKVVSVAGMDVAFHWCPPGTFTMGSPESEAGRGSDETQHRVTLTKGFWIGETEVTQELWEKVMGNNPSSNKKGRAYPVENVSWNDCKAFVEALNARSDVQSAGLCFAMPTEAQWEYACRAGTTGAYGGTGRLDDMGWYDSNSGNSTHPVAQKKPNAWGLYDMHGNVWEWCADWYGAYPTGTATEPTGPSSGDYRVLRGGGCWDYPRLCRSAYRRGNGPDDRYRFLGFRLLAFPDGR